MERYDFSPDNLKIIDLSPAFPDLIERAPEELSWPYLRREVPHIWRVDARSDPLLVGVLSFEEANLLYNLALPFRGKRGLEIGCHYGWSTAHLVAAGLILDVVDPNLANPDQHSAVDTALKRIVDNPGSYTLHARFSPAAVSELASYEASSKWSFAFIDGNHDGDAPRLDAEVVEPNCADDAMVVFHDLASPFVADGLRYFKEAGGWRTRIYNTMQIMGVAWRGSVEPVSYSPDPAAVADHIDHLSGFEAHEAMVR